EGAKYCADFFRAERIQFVHVTRISLASAVSGVVKFQLTSLQATHAGQLTPGRLCILAPSAIPFHFGTRCYPALAGPAGFCLYRHDAATFASLEERPTMNGTGAHPPKLRILLVEDDEDTVWSLSMLLRVYGHEVDAARDGPTALRLAEDHAPDVALLDFGLPGGMDGCEIARRLRGMATDKPPFLLAGAGDRLGGDPRRFSQTGS